jgi:hypothetical protein
MDARCLRSLLVSAVLACLGGGIANAASPELRTQNFLVRNAPSREFAEHVGREAERFRQQLALQWLGRELGPWSSPCTLNVVAGNIPAQGVTTYQRYPGYVGDFQMEVVGTPERILDSVLPHEVTHAVLATHFGRPLPRWADEGISTTVEHPAEKAKHDAKLREFLQTKRGLPMNRMFMMKEYPPDMLPLYAQGYSVCRFLIEQQGHREFIQFIDDYMKQGSWTQAVQKHYGYSSLGELQDSWLAWVANGSGPVDQYAKRSSPPNRLNSPNTPPSLALVGNVEPRVNGQRDNSQRDNSQRDNSQRDNGWTSRPQQVAAATNSAATASPYSTAQPQAEQGGPGDSSPYQPLQPIKNAPVLTSPITTGAASDWSPAKSALRR